MCNANTNEGAVETCVMGDAYPCLHDLQSARAYWLGTSVRAIATVDQLNTSDIYARLQAGDDILWDGWTIAATAPKTISNIHGETTTTASIWVSNDHRGYASFTPVNTNSIEAACRFMHGKTQSSASTRA